MRVSVGEERGDVLGGVVFLGHVEHFEGHRGGGRRAESADQCRSPQQQMTSEDFGQVKRGQHLSSRVFRTLVWFRPVDAPPTKSKQRVRTQGPHFMNGKSVKATTTTKLRII